MPGPAATGPAENPGFRAAGLLTLEIELPTDSRYQKPEEQARFFRDVEERVTALPGLTSAALGNVLPLSNSANPQSHPVGGRGRGCGF